MVGAQAPPWGGIQGVGSAIPIGPTLVPGPRIYRVVVDPSRIAPGTLLRVWPNPFNDPRLIFTAVAPGADVEGQALAFFDPSGRRRDWPTSALGRVLLELLS